MKLIKWLLVFAVIIVLLVYSKLLKDSADEWQREYEICESLMGYMENQFDSLMLVREDSIKMLLKEIDRID